MLVATFPVIAKVKPFVRLCENHSFGTGAGHGDKNTFLLCLVAKQIGWKIDFCQMKHNMHSQAFKPQRCPGNNNQEQQRHPSKSPTKSVECMRISSHNPLEFQIPNCEGTQSQHCSMWRGSRESFSFLATWHHKHIFA